jgi:hypothetical protein
MLAVARVVMAVIFEPDTPGGLRLSMDCRTLSSSATADDMTMVLPIYTVGGRYDLLKILFLTRC